MLAAGTTLGRYTIRQLLGAGQGALERAARLGGAAEELREAVGAPLQPLEQRLHDGWLEHLRGALDPDVFEREWAIGRSMDLDDAVAEALESD